MCSSARARWSYSPSPPLWRWSSGARAQRGETQVAVIGAAGEMAPEAIEALTKAREHLEFLLSQARPDLVEPVAKKLGSRAKIAKRDLYDAANLARPGRIAGRARRRPHIRTFEPVIEACLELTYQFCALLLSFQSTESEWRRLQRVRLLVATPSGRRREGRGRPPRRGPGLRGARWARTG